MDGKTRSDRPAQAQLERFPPEVAEINSKYHMNASTAMETRQISGLAVSFGPGMEVAGLTPAKMTNFPSYQVECKTVHLYWDRQWSNHTIMSWDASSLLTIHSLFLCGGIKIRGKQVNTHYSYLGPGSGTLELSELHPSVTEEEIKGQIPHKLLLGAKWSTITPKCRDISVLNTLLTTFNQFGHIKDRNVETLPTMMRLTALFENEEDARRAVEVLDQSPLPANPQQKLTARLGYEIEIKGPEEWIRKVPGHLLSSVSVLRNIHYIKYVLSLYGELQFCMSGENREVLVEAIEWIRELRLSGQIHGRRPRSQDSTTTDQCCAVCYDTAVSPVITQCKHVYCSECFDNMCSSTFSIGSSKDRVVCQAPKGSNTSTALDSSICGCTLGLPELRELLESSTYERLLTASFKSYVHRHPGKMQNCPTTDCDYIYFIPEPYNQSNQHNDNPATAPHITCPHCLATICIRCQEGHVARGMTCLEFQDHLAEGTHSMARIKEEQGIKNCPTCTTYLVKEEGCNHVTCAVCDTHMCWNCLEVFTGDDAVDRVYSHLNAEHGGIDDYPPDDDFDIRAYWDENDDEDHDNDDWWERDQDLQAIRAMELEIEFQQQELAELREFAERNGERIDAIIARDNGGNAANRGIEIEDEEAGLRNQEPPEAQHQGVWLEGVALHEDGQMNEPVQSDDWGAEEGIDIRILLRWKHEFGFPVSGLDVCVAIILCLAADFIYDHVPPVVRRVVGWFLDRSWALCILLFWIFSVVWRLMEVDGPPEGRIG
ncbi:hypothetical protein SMACR_00531 [Sordaria macrospora]|uniref:WGS project CABT00000000 data, contig 2.1 n=2 Tax=Sordaria macrospora TaxID=5147 RepID=F7VLD9_SORMK|nr:uncharacterized protein SMAC_00531 [Sordaria macrospora k-hell]KAA8635437.1 hypothetical protein SMACR_00531 [Sordaria macrospora]WPJ59283.1 hypothetical protein SMAC4_00531 [Sordaria macrospora]CCC06316.1 unnamed protein product [Sordaria macrospora k-hell]